MKMMSCLFLLGTFFSAIEGHAAEKSMNIILLYADDFRFDSLGCAGNPIVQTPELDTSLIRLVGRMSSKLCRNWHEKPWSHQPEH